MESPAIPGVEAQRDLEMLDRQIRLTCKQPKPTAHVPAISEARVERERTVDQCDRRIDFLAEAPECHGGTPEDTRIVTAGGESPPGKFDGYRTIGFGII